ncbi:MAG: PAS domain-containing sensor histidine kinase, partial [Patescibacteria group bacterium]
MSYEIPENMSNAPHSLTKAIFGSLDKNVLVSITDIQGTIIYANDKFVEVSKYSREELIGQNHRILKSGFHSASFYEELWRTISAGRTWRGEIKNKAKDGSFYWVDANLAPIFTEDNKISGYIAIRFLITDRKLAEADLKKHNLELIDAQKALVNLLEDLKLEKGKFELLTIELNKFQLAVENSFEHVIITDPEGIILYVNKAAEKNTGYLRGEIIGQKPSLWGRQMNKEFYESLWRTIKLEKKPFSGELRNRRKNGDIYEVDLQAFPVLDGNGNIRFFVGIERDITEQKKLEDARTNFISIASHQLRTPLTSIKWITELLLAGDIGALREKQKEYVGDLYASSKRMIDLVNGLLNIARIESAEIKIKSETVDLANIYATLLKEFEPLILQKHHSFFLEIKEGFPRFKTDPNIFREVLKNLLSNAIKYTLEGGVIKTGALVNGDEVIISVKDNGLGIPKAQQSRIFQKFFRADNVVRMNTDGTGLGMYIVKSLVELLEGKIRFESEENIGTTFSVTLPLKGPDEHEGTKTLV